jgi:hypothetical protein
MGDHVYMWCSVGGIPCVFQHHGIVLDVLQKQGEEEEDKEDWYLCIADFSNWSELTGGSSGLPQEGSLMFSNSKSKSCLRTYESSICNWHKVEYNCENMLKRCVSRSGTCTSAPCCPPGLVRARLEFLLNHPDVLPPYSASHSNCECVAVWCKTGTWCTLQATSWLSTTAAGQAKSAVVAGSIVSATQISVPAAGMWGWLGYTTTTTLAAVNPFLLPAIAVYGVVTVGAPALWLMHAQKTWKELTAKLNDSFWAHAIDQPAVFVECITEWSNLRQS